jgi:hypothetical protein
MVRGGGITQGIDARGQRLYSFTLREHLRHGYRVGRLHGRISRERPVIGEAASGIVRTRALSSTCSGLVSSSAEC